MNSKQLAAYQRFTTSEDNIGLVGAGGTGKSFVFLEMIKHCKQRDIVFAVAATTGVAANLINGKTLHKTLGLDYSFETTDADSYVRKVNFRHTLAEMWNELQVLFIDEASMLRGEVFDKLEYAARKIRKCEEPFGGVRIVFSADFLQLGPVVKKTFGEEPVFNYLFESSGFKKCFPQKIVDGKKKFESIFSFEELIRQQSDPKWGELLSRVRLGKQTSQDLIMLATRRNPVGDFENALKLSCINEDVDKINDGKLKELLSKGATPFEYKFSIQVDASIPKTEWEHLVVEDVKLCKGARVMHMVNNDDQKIFNGSTGTIVGLNQSSVTVEFDSKNQREGRQIQVDFVEQNLQHKLSRKFLPLKLAWASTIHKCQGATLTKAVINLSRAFAPGQFYTALSRLESIDGLKLSGFQPSSIKTCERCLNFVEKLS